MALHGAKTAMKEFRRQTHQSGSTIDVAVVIDRDAESVAVIHEKDANFADLVVHAQDARAKNAAFDAPSYRHLEIVKSYTVCLRFNVNGYVTVLSITVNNFKFQNLLLFRCVIASLYEGLSQLPQPIVLRANSHIYILSYFN